MKNIGIALIVAVLGACGDSDTESGASGTEDSSQVETTPSETVGDSFYSRVQGLWEVYYQTDSEYRPDDEEFAGVPGDNLSDMVFTVDKNGVGFFEFYPPKEGWDGDFYSHKILNPGPDNDDPDTPVFYLENNVDVTNDVLFFYSVSDDGKSATGALGGYGGGRTFNARKIR